MKTKAIGENSRSHPLHNFINPVPGDGEFQVEFKNGQ
jgi:hypothetical protein